MPPEPQMERLATTAMFPRRGKRKKNNQAGIKIIAIQVRRPIIGRRMSKPMRAKMTIQSILKTDYSEIVTMAAVYGGATNDEDNSFAKTTPSGKIELSIANKELHGVYKPGDTFYVDFTPVPKT